MGLGKDQKAFLLALMLAPALASAHEVGLSRGEYKVHGAEIAVDLHFSKAEVERAFSKPEAITLRARGDGEPCEVTFRGSEVTEADGLRARLLARCPLAPREIALELDFLRALPAAHEHLASVSGDATTDEVVLVTRPELRISRGAQRRASPLARIATGVEHILTGWDHLAFLLGLVIVGGRLRSLLLAITAFTVAHSITLGLAALGVVRPSSVWVEPAIALSVLYMGVENLHNTTAEGRWKITFPFGLVHGFGFAGALAELEVPRAEVPLALFSFNAGVELGQLGVLALVLPVLALARRSAYFSRYGVRAVSLAIALAGAVWFVARVI